MRYEMWNWKLETYFISRVSELKMFEGKLDQKRSIYTNR